MITQSKVMQDEKDTKMYKVAGTMNLFHLVPDLIYVIYECDGKYYMTDSNECLEITMFIEEHQLDRIRFLTDSNAKLLSTKENYSVGDEGLCAFQSDKDNIVIGTFTDIVNYVRNIEMSNEFLVKEIRELDEMIVQAKELKKKR